MKEAYHTEVLIIGGGPSGMLSAIYLDTLGISSIVLERQHEIAAHPKAHELSARSIEILCQLGFSIEALKKEASSYEDASRILFGHTINEEIGEIDLLAGGNDEKYSAHLASPEPYLNLSQTELEKIIRQKLQDCVLPQLHIGHQWEEMAEVDDGVISRVYDRNNEQHYNIKSQYVICADGAGSRSRKALGIKMLGDEKIDDFISVYFELNLRDFLKKTAKLFWIMNPAAPGTFIAHHIEKRWVYHFPIFAPYEKQEQFTEARLKKRILTALGDHSIPLDIKSISFWRMSCQIAQTFRKGRCFLVGDAAHRFPPTGGLGMNSGIGDVQNLCWKLAWVIQGVAGQSLLDTYEQERRPVIALNSAESLHNYFKIWEVPKAMGLNPKAMKWQAMIVNSALFKALPESWSEALLQQIYQTLSRKILAIPQKPKLHQKVKRVIQDQIEHFDRIGLDLGYVYQAGALIPDEHTRIPEQGVSSYQPSVMAGVRFPHFWVAQQGQRLSAHEWLQADKFVLLCNNTGEACWTKQAAALAPELLARIQMINVEDLLKKQAADALVNTFYKIEDVPLLLIRPDGQIAWKAQTTAVDLHTIFQQLLAAI
jgi:2,4-dichlorophenol 6-monooxygenase